MADADRDKLGSVIDRFYEAAVQPELWRTVLHEASLALGAEGCRLTKYQDSRNSGGFWSQGVDELAHRLIHEGWAGASKARPSTTGRGLSRAPQVVTRKRSSTGARPLAGAAPNRVPPSASLLSLRLSSDIFSHAVQARISFFGTSEATWSTGWQASPERLATLERLHRRAP